jgi:hypothetical protein
VIVSVPALNPFAAVTATLLSVASPPETGAVPKVVLLTEKVTVPVRVPAVAEPTDAVNPIVSPSDAELVEAETVVVVAA